MLVWSSKLTIILGNCTDCRGTQGFVLLYSLLDMRLSPLKHLFFVFQVIYLHPCGSRVCHHCCLCSLYTPGSKARWGSLRIVQRSLKLCNNDNIVTYCGQLALSAANNPSVTSVLLLPPIYMWSAIKITSPLISDMSPNRRKCWQGVRKGASLLFSVFIEFWQIMDIYACPCKMH